MLEDNLTMDTADRIYGTYNGGEIMPPGLRFIYTILFKHYWMAYTSAHKENTTYSPIAVWNAIITRLKIVMHAFEIETIKKINQIETYFHQSNGYSATKAEEMVEKELTRRNEKLKPLGTLTYDEPTNTLELEKNFTWAEIQQIPEDN